MEESGLLQADVSLPAQYWDAVARRHQLEPERKLLLAVLENAIRTYRQYVFTPSRLLHEVEDWLFDQNNDDPFSFETICDALGLSPECVRRGILRSEPKAAPGTQAARLAGKKKKRRPGYTIRKHGTGDRVRAAV
ncbi:MAG TPA: hypothetical protein VGL11_24825 [Candidatus Binatia bacterium]|jgi:hypothetical protein